MTHMESACRLRAWSLGLSARLVIAVGVASMAAGGCADEECSNDSDCSPGLICVSTNECVPNPLLGYSDGGVGGNVDANGSGLADASADASTSFAITCAENSDSFDVKRVYALGKLSNGNDLQQAVVDLESGAVSVGFDPNADSASAVLRADGKLAYVDSGVLYAFTKDTEQVAGSTSMCTYPVFSAVENDQALATPGCSGAVPRSVMTAPDDAESLWYQCGQGIDWYDETGATIDRLSTRTPLRRGANSYALASIDSVESPGDLLIIDEGGGELGSASLSQEDQLLAYRSATGGFWLAIRRSGSGALERWIFRPDGTADSEATYPALPANVTQRAGGQVVLSGDGDLFMVVDDAREGTAQIAIAKLNAGGTAEVIYSEANTLVIELDGVTLVTGP